LAQISFFLPSRVQACLPSCTSLLEVEEQEWLAQEVALGAAMAVAPALGAAMAVLADTQVEHAVVRVVMVAALRKGRIAPLVASAVGVVAQAMVHCRMWAQVRGSTCRKQRTSMSGMVEI